MVGNKSWFWAVLVLVGAPCMAGAQEAPFLTAAGLYPTGPTELALQRQVVTLVENADGQFSASVLLVLHNATSTAAQIDAAVPIDASRSLPQVGQLAVYIDGRGVVSPKPVVHAKTDERPWSQILMVPLTVPAGARVSVLLQYQIPAPPEDLVYLLGATGGWKGAVEETRFDVRFSRTPLGLCVLYGDTPIAGYDSFEKRRINKPLPKKTIGFDYTFRYVAGPQRRMTLTLRDLKPTKSLTVTLAVEEDVLRAVPARFDALQDPDTGEKIPCADLLVGFASTLDANDDVLACYASHILSDLVHAGRGRPFKPGSKPHKILYDSGLITPSAETFQDTWLTNPEREALDVLRQAP